MAAGLRIGIDLGGTKVAGIALDATGTERAARRIATPRDDYEATVEAVASLVEALDADAGGRGSVGIGIPGSLSPASGRVQNANSVWLNGRTLDRDLERRLGRPVRLANDADCFALSEATDGAGQGARIVFGVILGTGCGGGIVFEGKCLTGPRAIGGEWGHNPLPWARGPEHPGPACWCGRQGCMETFVSGPAIAADHAAATGVRLDAREVARQAADGDAQATATLERHADRLARGLAHVVNIVDPDIIVLGGGLSNLRHLYRTLPEAMQEFIFAERCDIQVVPPRHGDDSGVRGAAWLWNDAQAK